VFRWARDTSCTSITAVAALAHCTLEAEHDGGDYAVIIAVVQHLSAGPAARPCYHHGCYARLAWSTPAAKDL